MRKLITIAEACEIFKISRKALYTARKDGRLTETPSTDGILLNSAEMDKHFSRRPTHQNTKEVEKVDVIPMKYSLKYNEAMSSLWKDKDNIECRKQLSIAPFLLAELEIDGGIDGVSNLSQTELAKALSTSDTSISLALKLLEGRGFLVRAKIGILINPEIHRKNTDKAAHEKSIEVYKANGGKQVVIN